MSELEKELIKVKKELEEELIKVKKDMEECDHLFIKQREGYWSCGFHSSDYEYTPTVVTCLKCGLNNQSHNREYDKIWLLINHGYYYYKNRINNEVFREQFPCSIKGESSYNFISDEEFGAFNPVTLYQIAIYIKPNGTNEEIFNTMKELNEIQNREGRLLGINNQELLDSLKDRLSNKKRLTKK